MHFFWYHSLALHPPQCHFVIPRNHSFQQNCTIILWLSEQSVQHWGSCVSTEPLQNSAGTRGKRPENGPTFGVLVMISPEFDPTKDKRWNVFDVWQKPVPPVWSHPDYQKCTRSCPWHFYLSPVIKIPPTIVILALYPVFRHPNEPHRWPMFNQRCFY